jgi:hypothetical protein
MSTPTSARMLAAAVALIPHPVLLQGSHNLRHFAPHIAARKLCQLLGRTLIGQQSLQHRLPTGPKDIAEHIAQLHIGIFQHLLHSVAFAGPGAQQFATAPCQIA